MEPGSGRGKRSHCARKSIRRRRIGIDAAKVRSANRLADAVIDFAATGRKVDFIATDLASGPVRRVRGAAIGAAERELSVERILRGRGGQQLYPNGDCLSLPTKFSKQNAHRIRAGTYDMSDDLGLAWQISGGAYRNPLG